MPHQKKRKEKEEEEEKKPEGCSCQRKHFVLRLRTWVFPRVAGRQRSLIAEGILDVTIMGHLLPLIFSPRTHGG